MGGNGSRRYDWETGVAAVRDRVEASIPRTGSAGDGTSNHTGNSRPSWTPTSSDGTPNDARYDSGTHPGEIPEHVPRSLGLYPNKQRPTFWGAAQSHRPLSHCPVARFICPLCWEHQRSHSWNNCLRCNLEVFYILRCYRLYSSLHVDTHRPYIHVLRIS